MNAPVQQLHGVLFCLYPRRSRPADVVAVAGIALLAILLAAPLMAAPVYRWVDENGQVHFTQQPPPPGLGSGSAEELVLPGSSKSNPAEAAAKPEAGNEAAGPGQASDEAPAEPELVVADPNQVKQACEQSRQRLGQLQGNAGTLFRKDAAGKLMPMPADEVARLRDEAQQDVDRYCAGE